MFCFTMEAASFDGDLFFEEDECSLPQKCFLKKVSRRPPRQCMIIPKKGAHLYKLQGQTVNADEDACASH